MEPSSRRAMMDTIFIDLSLNWTMWPQRATRGHGEGTAHGTYELSRWYIAARRFKGRGYGQGASRVEQLHALDSIV